MRVWTHSVNQTDNVDQISPIRREPLANFCAEGSFQAGWIIFEQSRSLQDVYVITPGGAQLTINASPAASQEETGMDPTDRPAGAIG